MVKASGKCAVFMARIVLVVTLFSSSLPTGARGQESASPFDHLLFFVTKRGERGFVDELVLQKLPHPDKADQSFDDLRRVVLAQPGLRPRPDRMSLLGVYGGHLLMIRGLNLEAIDLESGERRKVMRPAEQGMLSRDKAYVITGQGTSLVEIDLKTLKQRRVFSQLTDGLLRVEPHLAISPVKSRIAFASVPKGQQFGSYKADVWVFEDAPDGLQAQAIPHEFGTSAYLGGASRVVSTPITGWKDETTLLIASSVQTGKAGGLFVGRGGPRRYVLHAWDVERKKLTEISPVPHVDDNSAIEPHFWRLSDGELLLHIPELGDHQIDLEEKELKRTERLADRYMLRGHPENPQLWFDEMVIGDFVPHCRMSLSPDGKQVVWLPWQPVRQGVMFTFGTVTMMIHSQELGKREVMTAQFDSPSMVIPGPRPVETPPSVPGVALPRPVVFPPPPLSSVSAEMPLWVRSDQLERSAVFDEAELIAGR